MFKVGQTVWDVRKGKGVVIEGHKGQGYPVLVAFEDTAHCCYTADGKYNRNDKYPSLYFSEPKIEAATEPPFEPKLEEGSRVVIKNKEWGGHAVVTVHRDTPEYIIGPGGGRWHKANYNFFKIGEQVY